MADQNEDFKEYLAKQEAARLTDDAIAKAAGEKNSKCVDRPVCLVMSFAERVDLPLGSLLIKMTPAVANTLASMGLHEPVSMKNFPDKWWLANVDIASVNSNFESGGGTTRVEASTADLVHHYSYYYCEVIGGPFNNQEEINGCYLVSDSFDSQRLGNHALLCRVEDWVFSLIARSGLTEPILLRTLYGKFWVCGMGGNVCSTEELEELVRAGLYRYRITNGPFDTRGDADYAYDVLWEHPE